MMENEDYNQVWKKLFEGLCAILAINLFIIPFLYFSKLPEKIPVHFNFYGIPDSYGNKSTLFVLAGIGFVTYLVLLISGFLGSKYYNIPFKTTPEGRNRIVKHVRVMIRILRFNLLLIFNFSIIGTILIARGHIHELGSISFIIILILILVPVIFMFIRMRKLAR